MSKERDIRREGGMQGATVDPENASPNEPK